MTAVPALAKIQKGNYPTSMPLQHTSALRWRQAPMLNLVSQLLEVNQLHDIEYVEPYAGGASLALALLYEEYAASIHINDLSLPLFAFWHTTLHHTEDLCHRIEETPITIDEWYQQRSVYRASEADDLPALGFATLFLNRTNRSGIIDGGVIGGKEQTGSWKLDCRFPKEAIAHRIRQVSQYRDRIHLYNQDALDFTNNIVAKIQGDVLAFYDPPYIEKGKALYLNTYQLSDHRTLATRLRRLNQPWIATYDYDAAVQHALFPNQRRLSFQLSYSAQQRHHGKEAMFFSDNLQLPEQWPANGLETLISAKDSNHPVFGRLELPRPSQLAKTHQAALTQGRVPRTYTSTEDHHAHTG